MDNQILIGSAAFVTLSVLGEVPLSSQRCPYCGGKLKNRNLYTTDIATNNLSIIPSGPADHTATAAILVPLGQALTVTLFSAVFAGSVASLIQWPIAQTACIAGTALGLLQWLRSIQYFPYSMFLVPDSGIEDEIEQTQQAEQERIILVHTPARDTQAHTKQLSVRRFVDFVRGCETNTAQNYWERIVSREQYMQWRDLLIRSGWARWRNQANPRQGWELAYPAEQIIRAVVEAPHSYLQ